MNGNHGHIPADAPGTQAGTQDTTATDGRARSDAFLETLRGLGIASETLEHPPVYTVEEARALRGSLPGFHTKNLFLKDKKDRLWLVVARADVTVDLKALRGPLGAATLSFGKPELLYAVLGVEPGSVSPFGLVNDHERRVTLAMDGVLLADAGAILNFHPLINTRTTALRAGAFRTFLASLGVEPLSISLGSSAG